MPPRLTIAIPTYNRAVLLQKSLASALAQTSADIQILVSDNGSTDGTAALLAQYDDPRLRKIRHETTMPRAEHGAFLFSVIETEFVLCLSDDDWIEPEFAAEALRLCDEHPEISFAYTGCIEHYDDAELPALVGPRVEAPLDFFVAHYAGRRQVSWCACVLRVQDIRDCGPQPPDRMIGDMFFWTKIGFKGPVGCVARPLSHYSVLRPGGDNESRTLPILTWGNEVRLLAQEVFARAEQAGMEDRAKAALLRDMGHYTTRSLANQFIWGRISGMSRTACLAQVWPCLQFSGWTVGNFTRVAAAIILPRKLLRRITVGAAAKMALRRQ
jgi:glycosyltransferase involved in cell wall biosynthesis